MNYNEYLTFEKITKAILAPFVFIYLMGFIGVYKFNDLAYKLHEDSRDKGHNDIQYAKRHMRLFMRTVFWTFVNSVSITLTLYFIFRNSFVHQ